MARKAKSPLPDLPTADQLIDFIKTSPGKVGKREIARAFSIKGSDRIALKRRPATGLVTPPEAGPRRNDVIAVIGGLILYAVFLLWLHPLLIGTTPLP